MYLYRYIRFSLRQETLITIKAIEEYAFLTNFVDNNISVSNITSKYIFA